MRIHLLRLTRKLMKIHLSLVAPAKENLLAHLWVKAKQCPVVVLAVVNSRCRVAKKVEFLCARHPAFLPLPVEPLHDDDYQREMYDGAAADIERLLDKMAEKAACEQLETERIRELNDVAQNISYGNVHEGVNVRVNRIASVDEELVDQFNYISGPLITISRQLQKSLLKQLKEERRGGKQTGLVMGRRLDAHALCRNDGKVFYKNNLPQEIPELAVGLLWTNPVLCAPVTVAPMHVPQQLFCTTSVRVSTFPLRYTVIQPDITEMENLLISILMLSLTALTTTISIG